MEQVLVSELIEKAQKFIANFGYKPSTIRHYNDHWGKLERFFEINSHPLFSIELSEKFLALQKKKETEGLMSASNTRGIRRAVYFLQEFHNRNGNIKWERFQRHSLKLDDAPRLLVVYEQYRYHISASLSNGSVKCYCKIIESFLLFLKGCTIYDIANVTQQDIRDFIKSISVSRPKGMHLVLSVLRSFLRFMIQQDSTLQPLLWAVPQNVGRKYPIMSTLTEQELHELDSCISKSRIDT